MPMVTKNPQISSATFCLEIVSVASHYGSNPVFLARGTSRTRENTKITQAAQAAQAAEAAHEMYLIFSPDESVRDGSDSVTPATIATTLPQGETRTILANVWDPEPLRLGITLFDREVWLCSRFLLSIDPPHLAMSR